MNEESKRVTVVFDSRPETLQKNLSGGEKKFITYVSSKVPKKDALYVCNKLSEELPVVFNRVENVKDIFSMFSNLYTKIDYLVIDVDDLYNQHEFNCFDIIRTLHTLINCTMCNATVKSEPFSQPQKRKTKIVALLPDNISKSLLKEIKSIKEINFLSIRYGGKVNYSMVKKAVENYINNGLREPKFITDFFKDTKPQIPNNSEIKLTVRQHQVFDIITTRGASNKHIAKMLDISESTVKLHVGSIFKKYGVKTRTQLAVYAKSH